MPGRSVQRLAWVCAVVALVLVGMATPASADTPVKHSGTYGRHYLADSAEYPGVRCHYDGTQNLDRIRVSDPFVFAFSNDPDSLQVSWRFAVQARVGSGTWHAIRPGAIRRGQDLPPRRISRP